MKLFGGVALMFLFAVAGWAQPDKTDCPAVSLSSPAGALAPGDQIPYKLTITGEPEGRALEFIWTTSNGKIVRGQGTREVVVGGWTYEGGIAVNVEIKGLPAGCPFAVSEGRAMHRPMVQEGKTDCPQITVSGPAGTVSLGDQIPYKLWIEGEAATPALEIVWTTSNGKIVRGQGTREAVVGEWKDEGGITVTVEVKGLPTGCPKVASDFMSYDPPPQARLVDDYGPAAFKVVKEYLLDSAARDFQEHQPPYPAKFRRVRIGHAGDPTKSGSYRLCGEFLPTGGEKAMWTKFATVKTSAYEQYLGASNWCTDKKITWDTKGDLASVLKGKLNAIKKGR